ncbi:MAG: hypothetical protein MHMPM18_001847 [Marteilia pararefringens]
MGFFLTVLALLHAVTQNSADRSCSINHRKCLKVAQCSNYEFDGSFRKFHIKFDKDTGEYQIIQKTAPFLYVIHPDDFIEACKNNTGGFAYTCRRKNIYIQNLPIIASKKLNEIPETTAPIDVDFMTLNITSVKATDLEDYFYPEVECAALELSTSTVATDWRCIASLRLVLLLALDDSKISRRFTLLDFSHLDPTTHGQRFLYKVGNLPRYSDFCDENGQKVAQLAPKLKIYNKINEKDSSFCRTREKFRAQDCTNDSCTIQYENRMHYVIGFGLEETSQSSLDCVSTKIPKGDLRFLQKTYKYEEPTLNWMRFDKILLIQAILATFLFAIALALLIVNIVHCYRRRSGTKIAGSIIEENFYMNPSGNNNDSDTKSGTNQKQDQAIQFGNKQRKSGDLQKEEGNAYQERNSVDFNAPKSSRVSQAIANSSPRDSAAPNGNIQNSQECPYDEYIQYDAQ